MTRGAVINHHPMAEERVAINMCIDQRGQVTHYVCWGGDTCYALVVENAELRTGGRRIAELRTGEGRWEGDTLLFISERMTTHQRRLLLFITIIVCNLIALAN